MILNPGSEILTDRLNQTIEAAEITVDQLLVAAGTASNGIDPEALKSLFGKQRPRRIKNRLLGLSAILDALFRSVG